MSLHFLENNMKEDDALRAGKDLGKSKLKFVVLILLIAIVLFVVYYFDFQRFLEVEVLREKISQFGVFAPLAYIIFYIVATVFFLPGSALSLAGGVIFGKWLGTIYTLMGATIGATFAFLIARYFGKEYIESKLKEKFKKLDKYNQKIEKKGFIVMLFLRFVPLFPYNGLNYAMGLTKIKFRHYFFGTLFGIIPGTFVFTFLGDSLAGKNWITIIIAIILVLLLMSILPIYNYIQKKRNKK